MPRAHALGQAAAAADSCRNWFVGQHSISLLLPSADRPSNQPTAKRAFDVIKRCKRQLPGRTRKLLIENNRIQV